MTILLIAHAVVGLLISVALVADHCDTPPGHRGSLHGLVLIPAFWLPLLAIGVVAVVIDAASSALRSRRP